MESSPAEEQQTKACCANCEVFCVGGLAEDFCSECKFRHCVCLWETHPLHYCAQQSPQIVDFSFVFIY